MEISGTDLLHQVDTFIKAHPGVCGSAERAHHLPPWTLLALGSRETSLGLAYAADTRTGDGGHGHGCWQLDDRSHTIPHPYPVQQQANEAAAHLKADLDYFNGNLKAAFSAYNSGRGGAHRGIISTGNSDTYTTHHDYGQDVLDRLHYIQAHRGH